MGATNFKPKPEFYIYNFCLQPDMLNVININIHIKVTY